MRWTGRRQGEFGNAKLPFSFSNQIYWRRNKHTLCCEARAVAYLRHRGKCALPIYPLNLVDTTNGFAVGIAK